MAVNRRSWFPLAVVFAALTVSGAALAAGSTWSIQATPRPNAHPGTGYEAGLRGVSCTSVQFCMAVGSYVSTAEQTAPLVERWNGRRWAMLLTGPRAKDVAYGPVFCWTRLDCIVLGDRFSGVREEGTVVERWNGSRWSATPAFNPAGGVNVVLNGLSCPARHTCFASGWESPPGQATQPIVEELNRGRWSLISLPTPSAAAYSYLLSISCNSTRACTAVGYYRPRKNRQLNLVERWNGVRWSIQRPPNPFSHSRMLSVACPATHVCLAVGGSSSRAFVEKWANGRWSGDILRSRIRDIPPAVIACSSARDCTIAGGVDPRFRPVAFRWTPAGFRSQTMPEPRRHQGGPLLTGIDCPATNSCVAVGSYNDQTTLAMVPIAYRLSPG